MALVISRAATIIGNSEPETNRMFGAPLSIIIGSIAGVAMEAEMIGSAMRDLTEMMGLNPENLN